MEGFGLFDGFGKEMEHFPVEPLHPHRQILLPEYVAGTVPAASATDLFR